MKAREQIEHALDESTVLAAKDAAEIIRKLEGGLTWSSPGMALLRDRFARRKRDQAVCRALLAELDAIDKVTAGKTGGG